MQAIILNSGLGRRMGDLTKDIPKCLLKINKYETILSRQLDILKEKKVDEFIITTGPYESKVRELVEEKHYDIKIRFIKNELYDRTNYIYSLYLIKDLIESDVLLLHGDLVFEEAIVDILLSSNYKNAVLINKMAEKPLKDFKAKIIHNKVIKISVNLNDKNSYLLQPFYRFSKDFFNDWLDKITVFIKRGKIQVYAEEALNTLLKTEIDLDYIDFAGKLCMEVDNKEDLFKAKFLLKRELK